MTTNTTIRCQSCRNIDTKPVRCGAVLAGVTGFAMVLLMPVQAQALHSPLAWYSPSPADDSDGDNIEDRIALIYAPGEPFDAVICFLDDCVPLQRLVDLRLLGDMGYASTVVASVQVRNLTLAELAIIAQWPEVGYIHWDNILEPLLTTDGQSLGAHAGFYSPDTAEDQGYDGTGITIAILDTGVDDPGGPGTTHDHLPVAVSAPGVAGLYIDANGDLSFGNPDDENGHGTAVAGCALGHGDAGGNNRGVAWAANLFDCRVTPPGASGSTSSSNIQQVVDWLTWNHDTVVPPVRVANLSFGGHWETQTGTSLTRSLEALVASGVVVSLAAGNDGSCPNTGISHIAVTTRAITVAAATHKGTLDRADDAIGSFSTRGPGLGPSPKPDITAYGGTCAFTCGPPQGCTGGITGAPIAPLFDTDTDYQGVGGTSVASPMVAGAAALLTDRNPAISPAAAKILLMDTAEDKGPPGWDDAWGAGLMNLSSVFQDGVIWLACDLRVKSVDYAPKPMNPGQQVTITVEVENVGSISVTSFSVDWEWWYYGPNIFPKKRFPIGAAPEPNNGGPLNPGQTRTFQRVWVPGSLYQPFQVSTSCFWGIVHAACDTNAANNERHVNTHLDTITFGGRRQPRSGPQETLRAARNSVSEVEFRLGHDRFGLVNEHLVLQNPDPTNWFAELDVAGQIGQVVDVPVDNQVCAVWGTLRTMPLSPTAPPVELTVLASDETGSPLGDMTLTVMTEGCPNTCGDIDGSTGNVNLVDFASFAVCFNASPSSSTACACSDLNGDGSINLLDFATLSLIFNGSSTNVPPNCP